MRQPARGAPARGEGRRQPLEAVDPSHLLDQVDLARDILAPQRRHGDVQAVLGGLRLKIERVQDLRLAFARDGHAEDRLHASLAQADHLGRRALGGDVDRPRHERRAAQLEHQARSDGLRVQALLGRQALLEAARGLAAQPEHRRAAVDVRSVPGGDLEQHAGRLRRHLRARAAHQPRDRRGPLGVLDHDHLVVERARLTIERLHPLALVCPAHGQARAGDTVQIEGVQRLAGEQHRVVGDVDDVVDRPLPRRPQPRPQPQRRRRDRHLLEDPRGEARAQLGAIDVHLGARERPGRAGILLPGRPGERRTTGRVQLPRHPVDAEAVRAVGRDLELEHLDRDRQHVGQRGAGRELGVRTFVEHEDAIGGRARIDLELVLGEDHPFRGHPPQLRRAQLAAVGHQRTGPGDRDRLPGRDVGGAADDRRRRPILIAEVDRAHLQPVGVRVLGRLQHAAYHEPRRRADAPPVDRLDLRAGHRQALLDPVHVELGVAVFAQPWQRDLH
jgi:hypothetical protein